MGELKNDLGRAKQVILDWRRKPLIPDTADERLAELIADLLQREREACARLADELARRREGEVRTTCESVAAAIRARVKPGSARDSRSADPELMLRAFLRINPGAYFCTRCLARELSVSQRDVQQACERLAVHPGFENGFFWCGRCAESRRVVRSLGFR